MGNRNMAPRPGRISRRMDGETGTNKENVDNYYFRARSNFIVFRAIEVAQFNCAGIRYFTVEW